MNKKTIVGVMLILCASLVFSAGLKKGKASLGTKKTEDGHWNVALIKASLQEWNPGPFNLPDETLSNLSELAEKGDGKACWQLARYFYCNGQIDEYIDFIKKGCVLLDHDCLYEILDNRRNQIPCTDDEKLRYRAQLKQLAESESENAQTCWDILNINDRKRGNE
ncbi:MAG: hypothetical protein VZR56_01595 [Treponema sp.]|nr:hypothetical protein [Treponema sp.]